MAERFIAVIAEALEKDPASMAISDRFREYEEWDSLAVLSVMVAIEETYGTVLSRQVLDKCEVLQDLFDHVGRGV
jgi:acyl carrier protein